MADEVFDYKKNDLIEGYRVLSALGTGAASEIYLVQDPKTKEIWALKHVHKEGHKDLRFLEQAEAEYEVASKLDHPNIRRIVRIIRQKSLLRLTAVILVMEFLDGVSLEKSPPEEFDEALAIFVQAAEALQHMHERGFVHADMKPNNILVCDHKTAKLIDLGQSCKIGTIKPRIQGTPDYIAPEQVHRRPITPQTDVYNFGATMYWTFTKMFIPTALAKGDSLVNRLDDNLIEKAKPAIELNPKIPPRLSELIMRCVEVDPDKRPQGMREVIDQLSLILGIVRAKKYGSSIPFDPPSGIVTYPGPGDSRGPGASENSKSRHNINMGSSAGGNRLNGGSKAGDVRLDPAK